jgi:hypothetical protein
MSVAAQGAGDLDGIVSRHQIPQSSACSTIIRRWTNYYSGRSPAGVHPHPAPHQHLPDTMGEKGFHSAVTGVLVRCWRRTIC